MALLSGAAAASQRMMGLEDELRNRQFQAAQFGANLGLQNRAMRQNIVNALAQAQIAKNPNLNPLEVFSAVDKGITSTGTINDKYFERELPKLTFKNVVQGGLAAGSPLTGVQAQQFLTQQGFEGKDIEDLLTKELKQQRVSGKSKLFGQNIGIDPVTGQLTTVKSKARTAVDFLGNQMQQPMAPGGMPYMFPQQQPQPMFPQMNMPQNVVPSNINPYGSPQGGW